MLPQYEFSESDVKINGLKRLHNTSTAPPFQFSRFLAFHGFHGFSYIQMERTPDRNWRVLGCDVSESKDIPPSWFSPSPTNEIGIKGDMGETGVVSPWPSVGRLNLIYRPGAWRKSERSPYFFNAPGTRVEGWLVGEERELGYVSGVGSGGEVEGTPEL